MTHNNNSTHKQCQPVNPWRIIIILSFGERGVRRASAKYTSSSKSKSKHILDNNAGAGSSVSVSLFSAAFILPLKWHFNKRPSTGKCHILSSVAVFRPLGAWSSLSPSPPPSMNTVRWKLNLFKINGRNDLGPAIFNGFSFLSWPLTVEDFAIASISLALSISLCEWHVCVCNCIT